METHVLGPVGPDDVPLEFIKQAFSYLDAATTLNSLMCSGKWNADFYRGRVVIWLGFHSTELFFKGCIIKLDPNSKITGHSLRALNRRLKELSPNLTFEPPFGYEELDAPIPEDFAKHVKQADFQLHELFRYPAGRDGKPWPGAHGFSPQQFQHSLAKLREDMGALSVELFGKIPGMP